MSCPLGNGFEFLISRIHSCNINSIAILTGAGVSVGSGIPDFRSAGGLYDTLRPQLLTANMQQRARLKDDPTEVVSYSMFSENQFPYLEVRRPFILGTFEKKWKPTLTHYFFKVLADKNLLRRLYTQNIDGLDSYLGLPEGKLVNIHGTIAKSSCEFCKTPYPEEEFYNKVKTNIRNIYETNINVQTQSIHILCENCRRPGVKPDTVLYGRNLPSNVFHCQNEDFPEMTKILFICGTSLTVSPACDIINLVSPDTLRILINDTPAGEHLGLDLSNTNERDFFFKGNCDDIILQIILALGWYDDIIKYRNEMTESSVVLINQSLNTVK